MKKIVIILLLAAWLLAGCTPAAGAAAATAAFCPNPMDIVRGFYDANDAGKLDASLAYLTDDVVLVSWAEGANGHHMSAKFTVGKDQISAVLGLPGLRRAQISPDLPNYTMAEMQAAGNVITFVLNPDRKHPDGRPYNPYRVEILLKGCKIEIIKVVERVTWL